MSNVQRAVSVIRWWTGLVTTPRPTAEEYDNAVRTIEHLAERHELADSLVSALLVLRRTGEEKDRAAFEEKLAKYLAPMSVGEAMEKTKEESK